MDNWNAGINVAPSTGAVLGHTLMTAPSCLRPGDTVAVVAPASPMPYDELTNGLRTLRDDWCLNVLEGDSLYSNIGGFAGSDDLRRADLQRYLDDPSVRAIFAARGGYGSYRLIEQLDFSTFLKHPKWVIGFSDITILLSHIQQLGVQALHAVMPRQFGGTADNESVESLRQWLFGENVLSYSALPHPLNRSGQAVGQVTGGNLTLLLHALGTSSEVDWAGKILFIEDVNETLFSLDRMLIQLRRSGRLADLAGLVVGQFTDMKNNATLPFGKTAFEIVAEAIAAYPFPVCYDFPIGHVPRNLALPVGNLAELTINNTDSPGVSLVFTQHTAL